MASITQTNIVILCFVSKLQKMKIETNMYYDVMLLEMITENWMIDA